VWCKEVEGALEQYQPDVVITHSGGAELEDSGPIIMDAAQTVQVCEARPSGVVVATHLEALDHCFTRRDALRAAANQAGVEADRLLIPVDGELVEYK
jgi:hypothetical protein